MTWINIVKKLKTIWSKGKYYIISALTGFIAFFIIFCLKKKGDPWKAFDDTQQRHDKEIDVINKQHSDESEKKEKERLVKGMKKDASGFEKRYPGRGEEVMYATATKQAKKRK